MNQMCGGKGGEKGKNTGRTEQRSKNGHQSVSRCTPFSIRMGLGPSSTMTPSLLGGTRFKKSLKKTARRSFFPKLPDNHPTPAALNDKNTGTLFPYPLF
jgi:hypothetical protein